MGQTSQKARPSRQSARGVWFVTVSDVIDALGYVPPEPMRRIEEAIQRNRREGGSIDSGSEWTSMADPGGNSLRDLTGGTPLGSLSC